MELLSHNLDLDGLILIEPGIAEDERGTFSELYKKSDYRRIGIIEKFVQENISVSKKGVLRGLHYQQEPLGQAKLVRCSRGSIFDVAVDIRPKSKTYLKWKGVYLSENNRLQLFIPKGFAHGFQALEDNTEVVYKCTVEYCKSHEEVIAYNDTRIGIEWPIEQGIIQSEKDRGNK